MTVEVVLVKEGRKITHRGRNLGEARELTIDRVWEVKRDGEVLGRVEYRMVTRTTRSRGKRYVNSRWSSPAYLGYTQTGSVRGTETTSRKAAVAWVVEQADWTASRAQPNSGPSLADLT